LIQRQKTELKRFNEDLIGMVKEKSAQVSGLQNSIINALAELVEFRDLHTGGHIGRTQKYMTLLLDRIIEGSVYSAEVLSWNDMDHIVPSTQLHDIGKIFITDAILNKPGKLTPEEFEIMKTHAARGAEAIRRLQEKAGGQLLLKNAEIIAASHHEKWDGSGYPLGLKAKEIPLLGRLMAIVDVYDALTSARPYKAPYPTDEALQIIIDGAGTHFDPALVDVFVSLSKEFAFIAKSERGDLEGRPL
jgi:putative two-component system response regulator